MQQEKLCVVSIFVCGVFRKEKMASNSYVVSVPKLKGRENYSEWCFAAENFLVLEGMLGCIKSEPHQPCIEAADDARTKAKLILTIDPSIYVHIKEVKTTKDLWNKLKSLYDDSGFTRRISLLRNLISIRLENSVSMNSYVTQIVETGQKLAGTGFNISDEWIGSLLLAGLTEKYSPMIMAIEHSGMSITTDAIKSKLLDMEPEEKETNNALASFQQYQYKKSDKYMSKGNAKHGVQVSKSNVNQITCYRCKQIGHYRNQCKNANKNSSIDKQNARKESNAFNTVFLSGSFSKSDWYVDSGASAHLTTNENWLINAMYEQCTTKEIIVANNNKVPVLCSGDVKIVTCTDDSEYNITVKNVLCVPTLTTNLLSVSQLLSQGNSVSFVNGGCNIYNRKKMLVARATLVNGVYKLNSPGHLTAACMVSNEIWHSRLGHINSTYLNKMQNAVEGLSLNKKIDINKSTCVTCCEGKQNRLPFPNVDKRSTDLLNIVHADVCGPMESVSLGGSRYFVIFIDDYSRMTYIYFMKNKNEVFQHFKDYKVKVENLLERKIKILRTDNGGEFCNSQFDGFLGNCGIIHQKTNAYTPEQNGLSERMNRTIVEKARCLLFEAVLDKKFWAEATNTAVYLQNRTISSGLNDKTPYELWTNMKPDVSHLRIFGSTVMVHVPKEKRLKWDKKSEQCIFVGYSENVKGYRVYNQRTKRITTSRDIVVMEKEPHLNNIIAIEQKENKKIDSEETLNSVGDNCQSDDSYKSVMDSKDETYVPSESDSSQISANGADSVVDTLPPRKRQKPQRYGFSNMCIQNNTLDTSELSLEEALQGPEKENWLQAIREELQCFNENKAWELVDAPDKGTIVKCKWVLKRKCDSDNNVRYRARLVAKGFNQRCGIDYNETFSPVVRHSTLRLLFSLCVQLNLDTAHLDVKTAFLNGELEETIYMQKPEGFVCSDKDKGKILRLKKAIYGLKQSSRAWYKKVDNLFLTNNYKKSKYEPCLYTKIANGHRTIVALYVDDFFIFSDDKEEMRQLKEILNCNFKIKNLGEIKQCLGMSVNYDKENSVITLTQEKYIDELLIKFNMTECKGVDTPMEAKLNIEKCQNVDACNPYQQLIGCLMYLAVLTRPDIAYPVGYLSKFNNCHGNQHWSYAKRILKYLKNTKNYALKYCKSGNVEINGYVDADWANNSIDRKSYSGFCFMLSGCVISWGCKPQKSVALSSTESEYIAISEACKEAVYLRNLQNEITGKTYTICIYNDNQSAQKLLLNPVFHNRTKHIDVRYHFCREVILSRAVQVHYLSTKDMPADVLTKSLSSVKHYKFIDLLGIKSV